MIKSERGSYSLYFMIILSSLLLFFGLLNDLARMKLVEHQVEAAVHAAVRSGLSYIDQDLHPFGLYAMENVQKSRDIAQHSAEQHLFTGNGFSIASSQLEQFVFAVDERHHLGNHLIFKGQLLEEMKYKAPIQFSLAVIDKFQNTEISQQIHAATALHKKLDELEQLRLKREEALDRSSEWMEKWLGPSGFARSIYQYYEQKLQELEQLANRIGNYTKTEVSEKMMHLQGDAVRFEAALTDARRDRKEAAERLDNLRDEDPLNTEKIADLEKLIDELDAEIDRFEEELESIENDLESWEQLHRDIETFEQQIDEVNRRVDQDLHEMRRTFSDWQNTFNEASNYNVKMKRVLEQAMSKGTLDSDVLAEMQHDFIVEQSFFYEYRNQAATITSLFQSFALTWNGESIRTGQSLLSRREELVQSNNRYAASAADTYRNYELWNLERIRKNKQLEDEQKSTLGKLSKKLNEVTRLFASCDAEPSYENVKQIEQKYTALNKADETEEAAENDYASDITNADKMPDEAIGILGGLQKAMLSVRDRAYVNEYALMQFNYRTYDAKKDQTAVVRSNPGKRLLNNQEAEYILYGLNSCELNQTAAFAEMYTLRMGIRTMEALLDPKSAARAASPLLAFLLAALEGAIKAYDDMKDLIAGKEVPLSSKWTGSITLNYKDYLRLFMMIHGNESKMMSRMQALIEWNTGKKLNEKFTFAEAEMDAVTFLWFLPGNERNIVRSATFSY